ncbi:MAG: deoxyribodipyrimidine photo-lyase [Xanthobacteraceae bacterium]|nr:deoxyribodipyrimidine photo-lyase [Xanthobacteraceae bacterium]
MEVPAPAQHGPGPVIVWFRDDLRLGDHPALAAAVASPRPIICTYVLDDASPGLRRLGGAARWWLAGSLRALADALRGRGSDLVLRRGAAADVISTLAAETNSSALFMNRRDDPAGAAIDGTVTARLTAQGVEVKSFAANLLHDPNALRTRTGQPFQVFTPFWRQLRSAGAPRAPLAAPSSIAGVGGIAGEALAEWRLEPTHPDWAAEMRGTWIRGEAGAQQDLGAFLTDGLKGYAAHRDRPDRSHTSRLSPRLRFGELSPHQVWHAAVHATAAGSVSTADVEKLLSELGWREFCYHLLHQQPALATANFNRRFDAFPWREDGAALAAWQQGRTGYPLIDAGMRQLWATGWMHNRVRMVTASLLIKHLLIDWRAGEQWFWDTLVDADVASNPANWQWVAGCGADAAPYFRIFNPVLQGQKFDPNADYIRRYVPELARLDASSIHAPERAPPLALSAADVMLGKTYPAPIIAHEAGRRRALEALATITPGER